MVMKMFEANKRRIVLIAFCLKFIAGRIQKKYFQNNRSLLVPSEEAVARRPRPHKKRE
jgi:hypothetical protein